VPVGGTPKRKQQAAGTADANTSGTWREKIGDVAYVTNSIVGDPNFNSTVTQMQLIRKFSEMSPQERIGIGNQLKSAGYQVGSLTGKATRDLRNAYLKAYSDLDEEIKVYAQQLDLNTFLTREKNSGAGAGGPRAPYTQSQEINDMAAKTLINAVIRDQKRRDATDEEVAKYTAQIRNEQKKNPLITAYTTSGGQTTGSRTTGGFGQQEAQQFLLDKVSQGDEAKANRALDAYSAVVDLFGGIG
jgi:hypothetical protein